MMAKSKKKISKWGKKLLQSGQLRQPFISEWDKCYLKVGQR